MKWIPGYKTESLPPIDNADYPKQYVVRVRGDDPHSGWIYISHETAEEMRDINEDGYWEWLDESPSTDVSVQILIDALQSIDVYDDVADPPLKSKQFGDIARKALAQYSTPTAPADEIDHQEIWDEFSELVDTDIDDLTRYAGREVMVKSSFKTMFSKYHITRKQ